MKYNRVIKSGAILFIVSLIILSSLAVLVNTPSAESSNPSKDSPWPCFGQNPQRTSNLYDDSDRIELDERREISLDVGIQPGVVGSPVITEDGDILQPADGKLFSINDEGVENWRYSFDKDVESTPAIADDGTIYIGSANGNLTALYPDGMERWIFPTESRIDSSPVIGPNGNVYFGNNDGILYSVDSEGEEIWNVSFVGEYEMRMIQSSPAVDKDGTVYVASTRLTEDGRILRGRVHAVDNDGDEKWTYERGFGIVSSPSIGYDGDGNVYIGGGDGHLFALDKETGEEVWKFGTANMVLSSPAIDSDGTIYVGSYDGKLYAVNPDGSEKWNFTSDGAIFSSPAISQDGTIYFGSLGEKIYAVNHNGTERWNHTSDSDILSSPAIGEDGSFYITSSEGTLYIFNPSQRPFEITNLHVLLLIGVVVIVGVASAFYFKDDTRPGEYKKY